MNEEYDNEEYREYRDKQDEVIKLIKDYLNTADKNSLQEIENFFPRVELL